jgi:cellobiose dehydrogenase (acceptor)
LTLLLHNNVRDECGEIVPPHRSWNYWHPFVNVSVTPNECSVVCPREKAETLFRPLLKQLSPELQQDITISEEDFSVITIGGEGLEAGQRVLDLTSPLALAGIPIFFITSYYFDFVLVPFSSRPKVIHALEDRGFVFEADSEDGEAGHMDHRQSPLSHARNASMSSSSDGFDFASSTPPPTTISDLQSRTFKILARNRIVPLVDRDVELVTCAGIKDFIPKLPVARFTEGKLQMGIAKCLTCSPAPKFFSITLTDNESTSLTLERRLLENFPDHGEGLLLGIDGPGQIPITLDFKDLPQESTGIVCGVSSRLIEGMKGRIGREFFNTSYLSTSRAGHVIVYEDELDDVMDALEGARQNIVE